MNGLDTSMGTCKVKVHIDENDATILCITSTATYGGEEVTLTAKMQEGYRAAAYSNAPTFITGIYGGVRANQIISSNSYKGITNKKELSINDSTISVKGGNVFLLNESEDENTDKDESKFSNVMDMDQETERKNTSDIYTYNTVHYENPIVGRTVRSIIGYSDIIIDNDKNVFEVIPNWISDRNNTYPFYAAGTLELHGQIYVANSIAASNAGKNFTSGNIYLYGQDAIGKAKKDGTYDAAIYKDVADLESKPGFNADNFVFYCADTFKMDYCNIMQNRSKCTINSNGPVYITNVNGPSTIANEYNTTPQYAISSTGVYVTSTSEDKKDKIVLNGTVLSTKLEYYKGHADDKITSNSSDEQKAIKTCGELWNKVSGTNIEKYYSGDITLDASRTIRYNEDGTVNKEFKNKAPARVCQVNCDYQSKSTYTSNGNRASYTIVDSKVPSQNNMDGYEASQASISDLVIGMKQLLAKEKNGTISLAGKSNEEISSLLLKEVGLDYWPTVSSDVIGVKGLQIKPYFYNVSNSDYVFYAVNTNGRVFMIYNLATQYWYQVNKAMTASYFQGMTSNTEVFNELESNVADFSIVTYE